MTYHVGLDPVPCDTSTERAATSAAAPLGPRRLRGGALACLVASLLLVAASARAQMPPPPAIVDVPDEPLPVWHPPPTKAKAMFMKPAPEVERAHRLRQLGLYMSSLGFAQLFAAGILYAYADKINTDLSSARSGVVDTPDQPAGLTTVFSPALEDQRDALQRSVISLFVIGGTMAATGLVVFGVGQLRIRAWHQARPREPLPPLSGY